MASGTLLEAPADRPAGQRGWRAGPACAVAVAALPVLAIASSAEGGDRVVGLVAAAALVAAAILIWTARRTLVLALAGVAVAAVAVAVVLIDVPNRIHGSGGTRGAETEYSYDPDGRAITRAQAEAVPKGSTEDEVEAILGSPAGDGTLRRRDGTDSHCLLYMNQARREAPLDKFAFCFAGESYHSLHRWL
jgi:hypothetical protein